MPRQSRMKALMKTSPAPGAELREVDVPRPGPGEVLVKVDVASICGTDVHIYGWDKWAANRIKPPLVFGHEFAGHVVELGPGTEGVSVGDYVSTESHVVCHKCYQCRVGHFHHCRQCSIIGVDRPGCFAEFFAVPAANIWHNPPDLHPHVASIQDPFGNAVDTVFAGDVPGRSFLVEGCGPIGLMAVALLRASGATPIIASDLSDYRLELAHQVGAGHVLNAARVDIAEETLALTSGEGVDAVLEMSGARQAIADALKVTRHGGRVTLLGLPAAPVALELAEDVIFKGLTVQGVTGRHIFETWYRTRAFLASGLVDVWPIITHTFPFEAYRDAFRLAASGECGKIILTL